MSKRDPKLDTKYENDDPDYTAGSSSENVDQQRSQPTRSVKKSFLENLTAGLFGNSSRSEDSDSSDEHSSAHDNNSPPPPEKEIIQVDLTQSPSQEELIQANLKQNILTKSSSHLQVSNSHDITQQPIIMGPKIDPNQQSGATEDAASASEATILRIVQSVLIAQAQSQNDAKTSAPKVDLQKLTMKNYPDWARKMKYALKLNKLWVEPTTKPEDLRGNDLIINERAVLFMACYLDDQNAAFINEKNEKCFITVWNSIKKFHQPRSATVLTDIHKQIQALKHRAGDSIESHLMKLETQFTRFHQIDKPLADDHLVALILASVSESPDFSSVFHSALWEDESSLTIAKVKSVLISTQRRFISDVNEQAHSADIQSQGASKYVKRPNIGKRHNRRPKDPIKGWNCIECEMDNHTLETCRKRAATNQRSRRQGVTIQSHPFKRANNVENDVKIEENANIAQAFSGKVFHQNLPTTSIKRRLGEPVNVKSSHQNATQSDHNQMDDILDINFEPNYDVDEMDDDGTPSSGNIQNLYPKSSAGNILKNNSFIHNHSFTNFPQNIDPNIKQIVAQLESYALSNSIATSAHEIESMKNFNVYNFKSMNLSNNQNKNPNFNCLIRANCTEKVTLNKTVQKSSNENVWIIDSGATLHMCKSSSLVSNFTPHFGHNVIISDGSVIPIQGYGNLTISFKDDRNDLTHRLILNSVAVVPELSVNLISVRALTSLGVSVKFTEQACYINHPEVTILLGTILYSSYILKVRNTQNSQIMKVDMAMVCIHEWHRKMGHRNIAHVNKALKALNLKVEKCSCSSECHGCLKGKFHALPFPQSSEKPTHPRDVVTTDVCGPFRTPSLGGSRYFVTFTCANTDYTEVAAIKAKSDCKNELINYIKRCMTQFGRFPKVIRSDRGGEYLDDELQTFLKSNGIGFQCTVARCP
jgi:hypothetical protein